jgi:cobalamin biosynthesis protein CobD/CbiB
MGYATPLAAQCRTLLVAFALDAALGKLPGAVRPVVQIGRWFRREGRRAELRGRIGALGLAPP